MIIKNFCQTLRRNCITNMTITREEAKRRWDQAVRDRRWQSRKVALAMFDYNPDVHGRMTYRPAPAWPTIADSDDNANIDDYERVHARLLEQADLHSKKGSAARCGVLSPQLIATPMAVTRGIVVS